MKELKMCVAQIIKTGRFTQHDFDTGLPENRFNHVHWLHVFKIILEFASGINVTPKSSPYPTISLLVRGLGLCSPPDPKEVLDRNFIRASCGLLAGYGDHIKDDWEGTAFLKELKKLEEGGQFLDPTKRGWNALIVEEIRDLVSNLPPKNLNVDTLVSRAEIWSEFFELLDEAVANEGRDSGVIIMAYLAAVGACFEAPEYPKLTIVTAPFNLGAFVSKGVSK